jgi:hypothetical protein
MNFLRYAWAAPATLLGLALSIPFLCSGARLRPVEGALEVAHPSVERLVSRLPAGLRFAAITFGHVIIGVNRGTLAHCRSHEHVHVRQYERWGVLFFPVYLGSSLHQFLRGRDPYRDNCFEREAFAKTGSPR